MASTARLSVDPAFVVAPVRRQLFGSFVEHMGRCVYTGIYEPDHPDRRRGRFPRRRRGADPRARGDAWCATPAATSSPTTCGRTASGRRTTDPPRSIWPGAASRPTRSAPTTSCSGASGSDIQPMITVNLGTRGLVEAVELLQYCNAEPGTAARRPSGQERAARAVRRSAVVPRQRAGRAVADRSQDRRGVRPAGRGDRQGHEALRRRSAAGRLRLQQLRRCPPSAPGNASCSSGASTSSTTSLRTPTTSRSTVISSPSWPVPTTWTASSAPWWPPPTTSRPYAARTSRS